MDAEYDTLGELMSKGEFQGFGEKFVTDATQKMNKAKKFEKKDSATSRASGERKAESKKATKPKSKGKEKEVKNRRKASEVSANVPSAGAAGSDEPATTYRAAIRTARGVVEDIGEKAASASRGLVALSKCNEHASERDGLKVIQRHHLTLPIPLTLLKKSEGVCYKGDLHVIRLRDWLQFIVEHNVQHMLTGLAKPDADREEAILVEFWRRFRLLHPDHEVWQLFDSSESFALERTFPLLLHGDEGRGKKKQAFLVCAYHSILGQGTSLANSSRKKRAYLAMRLNYLGNTHANRLLTCVMPKSSQDDVIFADLLTFMTADILEVMNQGIRHPASGQCYRAVCLSVCGDWQFLAKAGGLCRTYANTEKRPRGLNSSPKGICHLCQAGQVHCPFEDFRTDRDPAWKQTMYAQEPWERTPDLARLPHVPGRAPALFAFDFWHAYHLGTGKVYTATCLALISEKMTSRNIDGRFSELSAEYANFCQATRQSPFLKQISKDTVGWPDKSHYPNGMWHKGSVTTSLGQFIQYWLDHADLSSDPLLQLCREGIHHINDCIHQLYSRDVWLTSEQAMNISASGLSFLRCFMQLAEESYRQDKSLFIFMP
ncbi:unnamed protein product, partial [Durusdinium trenchii]